METILVHTPDFNHPFKKDGTFVDYLIDTSAVESFKNGDHNKGDQVVSYFDPEGSEYTYSYGYAAIGTIVDFEIVTSKITGQEMVKLTTKYEK